MNGLLRRVLLPARVEGGDDALRDLRVLEATLLSVFAFVILNFLGVALVYVRKMAVSLILLGLITVVAICLWLTRRVRVRVASAVLVFGLWCIATVQLALTGGITAPTKFYYVVVCVIAGLLLGRTAFTICVFLTIVSSLAMAAGESFGYPLAPYFEVQPFSASVTFSLGLVLMLVPLSLRLDELKHALRCARTAQRQLRESLAVQRRITESLPTISFITTDLNATITSFSPGAENIFGYRADEMIGQAVSKLHLPEDLAMFPAFIRAQREEWVGYDGEITLVKKNGQQFPASFITSPIVDDEGYLVALLGVSQDITERKRLEEQFLQAQKMEAVGRLAAGIAHEFNNLMCAVIGHCELLLRRKDLTASIRKPLETILAAGTSMTVVTAQLLALSRKQVMQPVVLNLNTVLYETENLLRHLIREDLELRVIPGAMLWRVKADPVQIEQVILNLAINARDAMPEGGTLTIETSNSLLDEVSAQEYGVSKSGPYVVLEVSDTGIGMSEETQSRIFEPFFTTKEPGKGTGLGLSTVYGIVKQCGGYVGLTSQIGGGTSFKIFLPRVECVPAVDESDEIASLRQGSETVLLVEDSTLVRELICSCLRESGYTVLEARSPWDGMQIGRDHKGAIPLLITDLVMPTMGGRALAEQLKALRPEMSVLFISGYTEDVINHRGLAEPGVAFLQKPFTVTSLTHKVREVLDGQGKP